MVSRKKFHSEKVAILKKKCWEEVTVLKKELLKKSSCSEVRAAPKKYPCDTSKKVAMKKCEEVAFPKIKLPENMAT